MSYVLSFDARDDISEIWGYIAGDNITAADKVLSAIETACARLAKQPQIGHLRPDLTDKPVRFYLVYSYLIVYRPETTPLEIARVLSGYRDLTTIL